MRWGVGVPLVVSLSNHPILSIHVSPARLHEGVLQCGRHAARRSHNEHDDPHYEGRGCARPRDRSRGRISLGAYVRISSNAEGARQAPLFS